MAKLTLNKQSYMSTVSSIVPKEEFVTIMGFIQRRIDRIARVQKAKNWKNGLTK